LEKSLGINPKNAQAMNMLGLCLISLGEIQEGLEAYEKTIKLDRIHKDVYFNKCQALKEVIPGPLLHMSSFLGRSCKRSRRGV